MCQVVQRVALEPSRCGEGARRDRRHTRELPACPLLLLLSLQPECFESLIESRTSPRWILINATLD
ncbi:MAG TPA: hypothetical protein VK670_07275, partial [Silvibacterium sp.]|nr:hypothetical protein [Silvibacterium sp.]